MLNSSLHNNSLVQRWQDLYNQVPLCDVPHHFAGMAQSQFQMEYLKTVLRLCPRGGRTCETGIGSGLGAIWLSLRGIHAEGIDYAPGIVERARQINNILGGQAHFSVGDLFSLHEQNQHKQSLSNQRQTQGDARYDVIHHQGVLEHFSVPWIRAALAQQVACAHWVVFSVPSVYYPYEPEFGDERLLPLPEWQRILEPFDVMELKYYGDAQLGQQEHILCVLRGQEESDELKALMQVAAEPYVAGISAIVHTRNEERHIAECLPTLQGWTDEIIVCDMESTDATVSLARQFTDNIIEHPHITNFDRARNVSAMRAKHRWVFYLDADERVPPALGVALRELATRPDSSFAGLLIPFRHHFAGHWMQCLYPGYTSPRLFRNGRFVFNPRPHAGAQVDGEVALFPADNPELALIHYSYDSLAHYLDKLNRYTDGEAANMHRDNRPFHWQQAIHDFVKDCQAYYDGRGAARDGVHGFLYSILSGFYRFEQQAKLYEHRFRNGQLQPNETSVPASFEQIAEYILSVARQKPMPRAPEIIVDATTEPNATATLDTTVGRDAVAAPEASTAQDATSPQDVTALEKSITTETVAAEKATASPTPASRLAQVVWSGPLYDPSGFGEESRNFVLALDQAEVPLAVQPLPWSHDQAHLTDAEQKRLQELSRQAAAPGFIHVIQNFPTGFHGHKEAGIVIGRTMFETDRLPPSWVKDCNRLDYVWVPSEFNRQTYARAGVEASKLVVIPGCFDPAPYLRQAEGHPLADEIAQAGRFVFLTVFDWTLHKGWDVLLRAFLEAFGREEQVSLVLKVWSTNGYDANSLQGQAADFAMRELDHDLLNDKRVRFIHERLPQAGLLALYQAADAFVLPSRGEGWGRPYMEAMACGLPTIGTNWSGNTAFMTPDNSYLLDCQVQPVPEVGWREIPTYRGHCWAEPSRKHLQELMRRVYEERADATAKGEQARAQVTIRYSREVVGKIVKQELERVHEAREAGAHTTQFGGTGIPAADSGIPAKGNRQQPEEDHNRESSILILPPAMAQPPVIQPSVAQPQQTITVRWEGAFFSWHSLAHVNREFCLGLNNAEVELSLVPTEPNHFGPEEDPRLKALLPHLFAPLEYPADIHVRHFFPPRLEAPAEGHLVLIQPWEYGYLPIRWIEPIQEHVNEVWCYSHYVREVYRNSGIAQERLHVVPLGVDTQVFNPEAPPYIFTTEPGAPALKTLNPLAGHVQKARFVFLFVGGTLHRKGIDILLEAYQKAFTALDDVCLVIKDTGTQTVYRGQNAREQILGMIGSPKDPPIVYLEEDLSAHQLAGLYTACDCLVQPYRGEGFCLPALEAMACGRPVIVPEGGPTDDFVDETVGWRVAAEHKPFGDGRIGEWDCGGPTWMFEVAVDDLARLMRRVVASDAQVRERGSAAVQRVQQAWTWQHACDQALQRLHEVQRTPSPTKTKPLEALQKRPLHKGSSTQRPQLLSGQGAKLVQGLPLALTGEAGSHSGTEVVQALSGNSPTARRTVSEHCEPPRTKPANANLRTLAAKAAEDAKHNTAVLTPALVKGRSQPSISLCMIVRNEERVLGDCLESIKPWVDEIIVVDTGSTDRTVEIAEKHGARVFHFPWCDSFSAARNESLKYATGDWILWMDADDTIPAQCGQELHELVMVAEEGVTGFLMQVHIPPAPGDTGFTVVDHVKLFRNLPELRFDGRIHEQILEPIYRVGGRIERSDLYVVHSGYDYSPEGQARKRERDLLLLQKDLEERPDHPFVLFNIGMTAYHLKDFDKALPALERCLALSKPQESTVRKVHSMLAGSYLERGDINKAVAAVEQGLKRFPHDPELLFRAGIIYREAGNLPAAEQSYVKLLTARETGHIDSLDVTMTGFKARHNLALIYMDMGRLEDAEAQWRAALADNPQFVPSWLGLAEIYLRLKRLDDVRAVVVQLDAIDPGQAKTLQERLNGISTRVTY